LVAGPGGGGRDAEPAGNRGRRQGVAGLEDPPAGGEDGDGGAGGDGPGRGGQAGGEVEGGDDADGLGRVEGGREGDDAVQFRTAARRRRVRDTRPIADLAAGSRVTGKRSFGLS
jgi:hypothetical protein